MPFSASTNLNVASAMEQNLESSGSPNRTSCSL